MNKALGLVWFSCPISQYRKHLGIETMKPTGDKIFSSFAYGTGGGLVKLAKNGGGFTAEEV